MEGFKKEESFVSDHLDLYSEQVYKYNAPHKFVLTKKGTEEVVSRVEFQEGPIKEVGVNGLTNEALLKIMAIHIGRFQTSAFKCRENACAITKIEEAEMWLQKRTAERKQRGVEGTNVI